MFSYSNRNARLCFRIDGIQAPNSESKRIFLSEAAVSAATERVVAGDTPATTEADDERRQQIRVHPPNPRLRVSTHEPNTSFGWHA